MQKIADIENIGVKFTNKLKALQIFDQNDLLQQGKKPAERARLAQQTDINLKLLSTWISEADLARIDGVGTEYAQLLVACDILCVQDLKRLDTSKLLCILKESNGTLKLVRNLPSEKMITDWIAQTKNLLPMIEK